MALFDAAPFFGHDRIFALNIAMFGLIPLHLPAQPPDARHKHDTQNQTKPDNSGEEYSTHEYRDRQQPKPYGKRNDATQQTARPRVVTILRKSTHKLSILADIASHNSYSEVDMDKDVLRGDILDIPYRDWRETAVMTDTPIKVLFLCTGNSCRSIMAEALLNELGNGRFVAASAGSKPAGFVHPQALACLNHNRIPVQQPHSKTWDDFTATDLDLVVTVCDNAAGETCPLFPGSPVKVHWGVPDPALANGSDAEVSAVFQQVFEVLRDHLARFVAATEADDNRSIAVIARAMGEPEVDFRIEPVS